jgi:hypothetical protein
VVRAQLLDSVRPTDPLAVMLPGVTRRLIDVHATPARPHDRPTTDKTRLDRLTDRAREVLVHVACGRSNVETVALLSVSTVKANIGRLLSETRAPRPGPVTADSRRWLWHGFGMLLVILEIVTRRRMCGRAFADGFVVVDVGRAGVERVERCWYRQR